jgi:hypothetical protein
MKVKQLFLKYFSHMILNVLFKYKIFDYKYFILFNLAIELNGLHLKANKNKNIHIYIYTHYLPNMLSVHSFQWFYM